MVDAGTGLEVGKAYITGSVRSERLDGAFNGWWVHLKEAICATETQRSDLRLDEGRLLSVCG